MEETGKPSRWNTLHPNRPQLPHDVERATVHTTPAMNVDTMSACNPSGIPDPFDVSSVIDAQ